MPARFFLSFALILAVFPLAAQVAGGPRFALVIGNGDYAELTKLKNPANDAQDMAAALKELGFEVKLLVDADLETMEEAVQRLGNDLARSADSLGFFFYAGHGVQSGGINYLIPADAHIIGDNYLKTKALPAQAVLDQLSGSRNALNVVVLDACRDNPFSWSRGGNRGLSVVGTQPAGSIVAYGTSAGSVAQDGEGRNGVFTAELLKQIKTPGLEINEVLKRTGKAVQSATAGRQVPAVYNQFFDSAYLAGAKAAAAPAPAPAPAPPVAAPTMTVTRAYGSLVVSSASAGILYLEGAAIGELPGGAKATLNSVEVGERSLELRYAEGEVERLSATVEDGKATAVSFSWKKPTPPAAAPELAAPAPAVPASADFVLVPAGIFLMSSPENEAKRGKDEDPRHEVRLSAFYMSKYELTFNEYDEYCAATGAAKPADQGWGRRKRPVINVSWNDAVEYCNWRSKKDGLRPCYAIAGDDVSCDFSANGYRLPTEAEWECAAKGGPAAPGLGVNAVYAGNKDLASVGWYSGNAGGKTHPVGEKAANALGLYDLAGNVWEWCWDRYGSYSGEVQANPTGASAGASRVLRGGCWGDASNFLRSSARRFDLPVQRKEGLGFRLVRRP